MNRLLFLANVSLPRKSAHSIYTMEMARGFSLVTDTELLAFKRRNYSKEKIFDFYKIKPNFNITLKKSRKSIFIKSIIQFLYLLKNLKKYDYIFTYNVFTAFLLNFLNKKAIYEIHNTIDSKTWWFILKLISKKTKVITVSQGVVEALAKKNIRKDINILPNGVNIEAFEISKNKKELRRELNLPLNKKIILYSGKISRERGIGKVIELAKMNKKCVFLFIGPKTTNFKKEKNTHFLGYLPHKKIPMYLKSADVLVAHYEKEVSTINEMCPMKVIEYIAANKPIIAPNLKRITEITNKKDTYIYTNSIEDMNHKLQKALSQKSQSKKRSFSRMKKFSWKYRAQKIKNLFKEMK